MADNPDEPTWRALADPTRRRLLDLLSSGPKVTGDLCGAFPELGRTTVMKHLDVLEAAGLVLVRREGRLRWNYLNPIPIQQIHDRWISQYVEGRARSLLGLREAAEERAVKKKKQTKRRDQA